MEVWITECCCLLWRVESVKGTPLNPHRTESLRRNSKKYYNIVSVVGPDDSRLSNLLRPPRWGFRSSNVRPIIQSPTVRNVSRPVYLLLPHNLRITFNMNLVPPPLDQNTKTVLDLSIRGCSLVTHVNFSIHLLLSFPSSECVDRITTLRKQRNTRRGTPKLTWPQHKRPKDVSLTGFRRRPPSRGKIMWTSRDSWWRCVR